MSYVYVVFFMYLCYGYPLCVCCMLCVSRLDLTCVVDLGWLCCVYVMSITCTVYVTYVYTVYVVYLYCTRCVSRVRWVFCLCCVNMVGEQVYVCVVKKRRTGNGWTRPPLQTSFVPWSILEQLCTSDVFPVRLLFQ